MDENPTTDLLNILGKAMDNKVYGSIEVYLEDGQITQISQRVIKKIKKTRLSETRRKGGVAIKKSTSETTLKLI